MITDWYNEISIKRIARFEMVSTVQGDGCKSIRYTLNTGREEVLGRSYLLNHEENKKN